MDFSERSLMVELDMLGLWLGIGCGCGNWLDERTVVCVIMCGVCLLD